MKEKDISYKKFEHLYAQLDEGQRKEAVMNLKKLTSLDSVDLDHIIKTIDKPVLLRVRQ